MMIDFRTDPSRYKHWKLVFDGARADLVMDVDEKGGLFEGYELKLNSYDLGVDIELYDAIQRLRFEHPEVKVVVLRSAKDRVFCAGANIRMLDLGCGGGNNAAFMAENGFSVFGIDGSPTAIEIAKDRFAKRSLQGDFIAGDLLQLPYEDNTFDFALDRESISMNRPEHIKDILKEVRRALKPGGLFCSFTYSADHPGKEYGQEVGRNTYSNFEKGAFEGRGVAHFFDFKELLELYGIFTIENVLKLDLREVYDKHNPFVEWTEYIILARK